MIINHNFDYQFMMRKFKRPIQESAFKELFVQPLNLLSLNYFPIKELFVKITLKFIVNYLQSNFVNRIFKKCSTVS